MSLRWGVGISIVAIVLLVVLVFPRESDTARLDAQRFIKAYRETPGAVLLDVRTPGEFASGHLSGARNIDFNSPSFTADIRTLDRSAPHFLYCRSGNRSGQAAVIMKDAGFEHVIDLEGGIIADPKNLKLVAEAK